MKIHTHTKMGTQAQMITAWMEGGREGGKEGEGGGRDGGREEGDGKGGRAQSSASYKNTD